jgi:transposase-like protein
LREGFGIMFRLKATLVATTLMRPWRTGWSVDRGVDFSLAAPTRAAAAPTTTRNDALAAEVRRFESLNAQAALETPAEDAPDTAGLRVWWSMSGKPSRT